MTTAALTVAATGFPESTPGGVLLCMGAVVDHADEINAQGAELAFTFTLGDGSTGAGQIQYTGTAPARSDFNGDGLVTAADWAVFVPNSFTAFAADPAVTAYLKGDLDGDKDNDFADFKLFKADYIAANGEAAFAALGAAVPEPATLALCGMASLALVVARRRLARS